MHEKQKIAKFFVQNFARSMSPISFELEKPVIMFVLKICNLNIFHLVPYFPRVNLTLRFMTYEVCGELYFPENNKSSFKSITISNQVCYQPNLSPFQNCISILKMKHVHILCSHKAKNKKFSLNDKPI